MLLISCVIGIIFLTTISGNIIKDSIAIGEPYPTKTIYNVSQPELQWTGGCFEFPCQSTKVLYKHSNKYISKNVLATRAQFHNNKIYFALPRYRAGIPATLVSTDLYKNGKCSTMLTAYPSWELQEEGRCKALQSVVDIVIDKNNILWALDTGISNSLEKPIRYCSAKIVAIDLSNGKVIKIITLDGLVTEKSRLQYLVVDVAKDGTTNLYISDSASRAIITYNVNELKGYRIILPKAVTIGCLSRDILYLMLSKNKIGSTVLYFSYLGAKKIFAIETSCLNSGNHKTEGTIKEIGTKSNRLVFLGSDINNYKIIFRHEGGSTVYSWDTREPFNENNFDAIYRGASKSCLLATHAFTDAKQNSIRLLESNFSDYFKNTVGCGAVQQIVHIQAASY